MPTLLRLATGALAASLLLLAPGCAQGDLDRIAIPDAGLPLAYDLSPGATFNGTVGVGNTLQIAGYDEPLSQSFEITVELVVLGDDPERGGTQLRAEIGKVELAWAMPPNTNLTEEMFYDQAVDALRGMTIVFNVDEQGGLTYMPSPPDDLEPSVAQVVEVVTEALGASFVSVPDKPLRPGARWTHQTPQAAGDTATDRSVEATFEGAYHLDERDLDVGRIDLAMTSRKIIDDGFDARRTSERTGEGHLLMAKDGFVARLDLDVREFDPELGTAFRKVKARWNRAAEGARITDDAGASQRVQIVEDPCDPDYVGELPCPDDQPAPPAARPPAPVVPREPMPIEEPTDDVEEEPEEEDSQDVGDAAPENDDSDAAGEDGPPPA